MPERRSLLRLALRLLRRDVASGRLLVMLAAAVIAVASTVSVNLVVSRVKQVMVAESSALLAGDLALVTRAPAPQRYVERAREHALRVSRTVSVRSVVAHGDELQLVRLKAVDAHYPLRGEVQIADGPLAPVVRQQHGPARGEVWADARLFQLLGLEVGTTLEIGRGSYRLARLLVLEPDRGGDLFAFAPRVMMNLDDLADSGLIVPGSRASYTLLLAGDARSLARFKRGLELASGHALLDPRAARPEMQSAFVQAERFLTLASFVGVLLAMVGIALAAAAYSDQHHQTVAVLKTLGLEARAVAWLLALEIALLAVLATILGDGLALLIHQILIVRYLPAAELASAGVPLAPLLHGGWVALVILGGFALPALVRLTRLPVTSVLNRNRSALGNGSRAPLLFMVVAAGLVAPWHLGDVQLVAVAFGGMLASAALIALAAWVLVILLGRLRARTAMGWRFGLANIARRARLSVLQATAIGLGIAVILLLGLVRNDLHEQWRSRLPARAPNQFLINAQADEVGALRTFLEPHVADDIRLYPMVRGRLVSINERAIDVDAFENPRARRLADREFNLSWASTLKADNRLVAGRWWSATGSGELSVEQGIAETLGIALGDTLEFQVAERRFSARVSSLREVQWDNFEVNFFVVTTPELLRDAPATYITSFYLDPDQRVLMRELVERFPSVTVIDVDALMRQVRAVMQRVSGALGWVFGFALAAGVVVLAAAAQASQRERALDVVLLKTLGAPRRFITKTVLVEFALLGALSGALGSVGAAGTGWLIAHYVLHMPYRADLMLVLGGITAGVVGVSLLGVFVVFDTHRRSVITSLREAT